MIICSFGRQEDPSKYLAQVVKSSFLNWFEPVIPPPTPQVDEALCSDKDFPSAAEKVPILRMGSQLELRIVVQTNHSPYILSVLTHSQTFFFCEILGVMPNKTPTRQIRGIHAQFSGDCLGDQTTAHCAVCCAIATSLHFSFGDL